jgi:dihydrodipicolinate synthase/N-acetylneuraminate lyase
MTPEAVRFCGVIPSVKTPFSSEGTVLYEVLEENLGKYFKTAAAGCLLLGSNGEAPHLNLFEKLEIVRRASAIIPADRYSLVGVDSSTLVEASDFLDEIEGFRIDAVLISVPSYYKEQMNEEALCRYCIEVASRSAFPVLLYNIPQFTGIEIPPQLVGKLATHHNIVGMKDYQARVDIGNRHVQLAQISRCVTHNDGIPELKYAMDLLGFEGGQSRLALLPIGPDQRVDSERVFGPFLSPGYAWSGQGIELST